MPMLIMHRDQNRDNRVFPFDRLPEYHDYFRDIYPAFLFDRIMKFLEEKCKELRGSTYLTIHYAIKQKFKVGIPKPLDIIKDTYVRYFDVYPNGGGIRSAASFATVLNEPEYWKFWAFGKTYRLSKNKYPDYEQAWEKAEMLFFMTGLNNLMTKRGAEPVNISRMEEGFLIESKRV